MSRRLLTGLVCLWLGLLAPAGARAAPDAAGARAFATIAGATSRVLGNIRLGGFANGVGVDPTTDTIYVAAVTSGLPLGFVAVIDGATNVLTTTVGLEGVAAGGVAVDPATDTIYATGNPLN